MSQYTAFVAVSDEVRVNPQEQSISVQVPVEMPEGISYEGIFGNMVQKSVSNVYCESEMPSPSAPLDPFDITLIDPGMIVDEEELQSVVESDATPQTQEYSPEPPSTQLPSSAPSSRSWLPGFLQGRRYRRGGMVEGSAHRLQIVSATGLDKNAIARVTRHLRLIELPTGVSGDLVFEFHVSNRHVRQVVLDEQGSSIHDEIVIEAIRRSLLVWQPPQSEIDTVRLLVRIEL